MNAFRAWWYRHFKHPDPDPVVRAYEQNGDTFGWQRSTPFIASDHPTDCADRCCFEIRLDELHDAYDWHAAEHEMRSRR